MGKVFAYAGELKKYMYSALAFLFLSVIFGVLPFFALSHIAVSLIEGVKIDTTYILTTCATIFAALALKAITMGVGLAHSHTAAFGILYNIRKAKAKDMTEHPLGYIEHNGVGKYKKGFVEDIDLLENLVAHMIPEGVPNVFIVLLTYVFIFVLDWRLGLLSFVIILAGLIPMMFMMKFGVEMMPKYYASLDSMNGNIIEYVGGMEVVKVFGKTTGSFEKLKNSIIHARNLTYMWYKACWRDMSIMNAVMPCTVLLALPIGIIFYQNGSIELNDLILTMLLNLSLSAPLLKLMAFMPVFPQVGYAIEKIDATFTATAIVTGNKTDSPENFDIAFESVHFSYNEETEVLHGFNAEFKQGNLTALVGESGSGKSTIAKLIVHFWDVNSGKITIGGTDIREFTSKKLMSMISYVSQDNILFDGSIMENLLMGKEGATKEDAINAAKASCCHDFIMALEKGYDTNVGTMGGKLSGGEKQRITIARAMLKDAPIIILDEATAHTDSENEDLIQTALSNLLKGKTVIVIAHRLTTITSADKIIVVDNGNLQAQAAHDELLEISPIYKKLWAESVKAAQWTIGDGGVV